MKKMILAATILAMTGASLQTAKAGDQEWATVGKILTGVVAGAVIATALDCPPVHASVTYTYGAPAYCPPPPRAVAYVPAPVVCPPPVVYAPAPPPVIVYRASVCAPRPVVIAKHGHHGGHRHGWGRFHCR